ncbi:MAG: translation initiation factor IF-2 [Candidatus Omnitrophica bacterium]|nr:translation initiation factor IF-2 [Candidatus Omnitrophota bacterium]
MTVRVHELSKELGIPSKDLVQRLLKLKVPVKGPMSAVDDGMVARIRQAVAALKPSLTKKPPARPKPPTRKPERSSAPAAVVPKAVASRAMAPKAAPPKIAALKTKPITVAPSAKPSPPVSAKPPVAPPISPAPARPTPEPVRVAAPKPPATLKLRSDRSEARRAEEGPVKEKPAPTLAPAAAAVMEPPPAPVVSAPKHIQLTFPITVKDLAFRLDLKSNELIKHLIGKRIFASLTHSLDQPTATQIAKDFGFEVAPEPTLEERLLEHLEPDSTKLVLRAPVVTFMGHVDHGKTSLLDAIRKTKVVEQEAGGITQHIGAYEVILEKGRVTFLDTPGHEAFTALRARGANVTDVVVLVVAADDGVMPQTIEAIDHAKAADVPIVVAVNKIDRPEANPQKVTQQLTQYGLLSEAWGGKTIVVPVSAKTGEGIDQLLEMLLLEAEMLELKADPTKPASGSVIEAKLTKDRGPIATLLVQQGTLRVGDSVLVGALAGRVRALVNDRGHRVKDAVPSSAVEVLGLSGVPKAGDRFMVIADEKLARELLEHRQERLVDRRLVAPKRITLDELHQQIAEGKLKELKLILKADVQGSLEAITQSLLKLDTHGVKLSFIHTGVGDISESDIMLAAASDAVVIGFHVGMDPQVQVQAIAEGVDVRTFQIIYELVNSIQAAIEGLLEPKIEETFLGRAEVKQLFQISKVGIVAGCVVIKGLIRRDATIRIIRGKDRLTDAPIAGLKRAKDDVREVSEGLECGIALQGSVDVQAGDLLEAWDVKKVARKFS